MFFKILQLFIYIFGGRQCKMTCAGWVTLKNVTGDSLLLLLDKATYYSSTESDKTLYLSAWKRTGRKGKTSVQTITNRKLNEKNEVQVLGGIPNTSLPQYLSAAHWPSSSRKSNLYRESDQRDRASKWSRVPCSKIHRQNSLPQLEMFPTRLSHL